MDKKLASIVVDLRALLPSNHVFPSENIIEPETDDDEKQITQHIDEFLYEDSELEELITERKIEKHFCGDCGSHNIRVNNIIISL